MYEFLFGRAGVHRAENIVLHYSSIVFSARCTPTCTAKKEIHSKSRQVVGGMWFREKKADNFLQH